MGGRSKKLISGWTPGDGNEGVVLKEGGAKLEAPDESILPQNKGKRKLIMLALVVMND
jgi:hypothetical protein